MKFAILLTTKIIIMKNLRTKVLAAVIAYFVPLAINYIINKIFTKKQPLSTIKNIETQNY